MLTSFIYWYCVSVDTRCSRNDIVCVCVLCNADEAIPDTRRDSENEWEIPMIIMTKIGICHYRIPSSSSSSSSSRAHMRTYRWPIAEHHSIRNKWQFAMKPKKSNRASFLSLSVVATMLWMFRMLLSNSNRKTYAYSICVVVYCSYEK